MKLFKRLVLAFILLTVVLGATAYFTIKAVFPPEKIKSIIHDQATKALNRDINIADVSVHLFPHLKLAVMDIRIANAKGFSAEPLFKVSEISLSIDFLSLLRFSPTINEIKIFEPEILYEVNAEGHNNLEGIGSQDTTKNLESKSNKPLELPTGLALKAFTIANGKVHYRDVKSGQDLVLGDIDQNISLQLDPKLENILSKGKLIINEVSISDKKSSLQKGAIRLEFDHDIQLNLPAEKLTLNGLEFGFQDISIKLKGGIEKFITKPMALDLHLQSSEISLASVLKEVPSTLSPDIAKLSAQGKMLLDVLIKGNLDSNVLPEVLAKLNVKEGAFHHKDLPAGIEHLNLDFQATTDRVDLKSLEFNVDQHSVTMNAAISEIRKVPHLEAFQLNSQVDFGKLGPILNKLGLLKDFSKLTGELQSDLQASGWLDPQDPTKLQAQGLITLKKIHVESPLLPAPLNLDGDVHLSNSKIEEALNVQLGQSDFKLTSTVENFLALIMPNLAAGKTASVKALIQSSFINLDELLPKTTKKEEEEKTKPLTAFPVLPKINAVVDIKLAKTQFMDLAVTEFISNTTVVAGVVNNSLKGNLYSGNFNTKTRIDLNDSTNAKVDLKMLVNHVEANDFLSRLNKKIPATNALTKSLATSDSTFYGKLNLDMDVKTHGLPQTFANNLTGTINVLLNDGKIRETAMIKGLSSALGKVNKSLAFNDLTFSKFTLNLIAENGKLLVKDCQISESIIGALNGQGFVGFDNTLNLNLENHLPPALSARVLGASGAVTSAAAKLTHIDALENVSLIPKDKSGRALLYFVIGGLVSKPTFALDSKRMAGEANSGVKQQLADELKKKTDELKAQSTAKAKAVVDAEKEKLKAEGELQKQKATEAAKSKGKKALKSLGF